MSKNIEVLVQLVRMSRSSGRSRVCLLPFLRDRLSIPQKSLRNQGLFAFIPIPKSYNEHQIFIGVLVQLLECPVFTGRSRVCLLPFLRDRLSIPQKSLRNQGLFAFIPIPKSYNEHQIFIGVLVQLVRKSRSSGRSRVCLLPFLRDRLSIPQKSLRNQGLFAFVPLPKPLNEYQKTLGY
ncbi:hypothetical protein SAMN05444412_10757 [Rhodonellum ikkaensis]|uniref:Maturase K n=1 Tax=Rhodonellum ikkaensis TaxID=336829 RepID=A0A1H3QWK2_9BACT|nr:hypothetical protein SAMN05444412_10757 [Rhodonellum ikkaensis]